MDGTDQPMALPLLQRPLLPGLAGIRYFAALHVCLHHLAQMAYGVFHNPTPDSLPLRGWGQGVWELFSSNWIVLAILKGALIQVGMFFVMSGFILTYSHPVGPQGQFSYRDYFLARVARVYAMYLIGLLVAFPIFYGLTFGEPAKEIVDPTDPTIGPPRAEQVLTTGDKILAATATPLLLQAWFPQITIYPWNPPAWSLSVEAFAYVVFPLLVVSMARWSTGRLLTFGVVCWIWVLIPPIWYVTTDPDGVSEVNWNANLFWFNFVRHNPICRLPEFLMGMVAGRMFAAKAAENARAGVGTGGWLSTLAVGVVFAVLILAEPVFGSSTAYMLLHNGLLAPVFAVGVVGLALGGGPVHALCSRPLVILLGESAYAIYMLHFPFLAYSLIVLVGLAKDNPALLPWPMTYTIFFLLAVSGLSVVTHKKWEIPWRRKIRHRMIRLWPEKPA